MKPPTLFSDFTAMDDSKDTKKRTREKRARKRMEARNKKNPGRLNMISEEESLVHANENQDIIEASAPSSSSAAPNLRGNEANFQQPEVKQQIQIEPITPMFDLMTQLHTVRAIGDGPNNNKVEGYLCQWMTGNVVIICHCHGSYFSPAEFVVHAGYTGPVNPMRHITVFTEPGL